MNSSWYCRSYGEISLDPWAHDSSCFQKSEDLLLWPYTSLNTYGITTVVSHTTAAKYRTAINSGPA